MDASTTLPFKFAFCPLLEATWPSSYFPFLDQNRCNRMTVEEIFSTMENSSDFQSPCLQLVRAKVPVSPKWVVYLQYCSVIFDPRTWSGTRRTTPSLLELADSLHFPQPHLTWNAPALLWKIGKVQDVEPLSETQAATFPLRRILCDHAADQWWGIGLVDAKLSICGDQVLSPLG